MKLTPSIVETMAKAAARAGISQEQVAEQAEYMAKVQGWNSKTKLPETVARAAYNQAKVKLQS